MGDLTTIGVLVLQTMVLCALIGFISVKVFVWGSFCTGILSFCYLAIPSLNANAMLADMIPKLLNIWMFYPELISMMTAEAGSFGEIAAFGFFAVINIPAYLFGVFAGVVAWPELLILRIFV